MQNQEATFLQNIKPADKLFVAQAVSASIHYINAKMYHDKAYQVKRLYKNAYWSYKKLSRSSKQAVMQLNLKNLDKGTRKLYNRQAYKYIQQHYVPKFLQRVNPKDRLNYATVINDQSFLDYEATQSHKSKRIPQIKKQRDTKWSQLPSNIQKDLKQFHQESPKVFDKMHFKAENYVKLNTPYKKSIKPKKQYTQQQSKTQYHPTKSYHTYYKNYTPQAKKTHTFLDKLAPKDRTAEAKAVISYYNYEMSNYDIESYGDLKEMKTNKKKMNWACKYVSPAGKNILRKLAQNQAETKSMDTLSKYAKSAQKYMHDVYVPKFLFHVPKQARYSYAKVLNDQGYLDFQKQHHFQSYKTQDVKDDLSKAWHKLPKQTQADVMKFHNTKPKIFDKMHFKAINYLKLHSDEKVKAQRAQQWKRNIKYAPPVIKNAQNKRAVAHLVIDYANLKMSQMSPYKMNQRQNLTTSQAIEQQNMQQHAQDNLKTREEDMKDDVPLFNKLNSQDKQAFRQFTSQKFNKEEYNVLSDQAYGVIYPSAPNDYNKLDRTNAIDDIQLNYSGHAPKHLRPSIQNRLILQYMSQEDESENKDINYTQYEHEDLQNAEDIAMHTKVNQASYQKTQKDQARVGNIGSFLQARAKQDAQNKAHQKTNKWHQMTKKNHMNSQANDTYEKRPSAKKMTSQQKQIMMKQNGQVRK